MFSAGSPPEELAVPAYCFFLKQSINYLSALLLKVFDVPPNFNNGKVQNVDRCALKLLETVHPNEIVVLFQIYLFS